METLHKQGKCRAIGISNFSVKKTQDLLSYAKVKPAVQQVEIHPYWRNDALVEFCQQQVRLAAACSLGAAQRRGWARSTEIRCDPLQGIALTA